MSKFNSFAASLAVKNFVAFVLKFILLSNHQSAVVQST